MDEFAELVNSSHRTLLDIGIDIYDTPSFTSKIFSRVPRLPKKVVDRNTLKLIQIRDLFKATDYTTTATGASTLFRSLTNPLTSLELILAKQESLRELEADDKLRNSIKDYLKEFKKKETNLFLFLKETLGEDIIQPYSPFKEAVKANKTLVNAIKSIPAPESKYLQYLSNSIKEFGDTELYSLIRGPIYRTFKGLKSKENINFLTPVWKFAPRRVSFPNSAPLMQVLLLSILEAKGMVAAYQFKFIPTNLNEWLLSSVVFGAIAGLLGMAFIKPGLDEITALDPLKEKMKKDESYKTALDSLGKLDELLSFYKYGKEMPVDVVIPTVTDDNNHYFSAKNVRNPILAKDPQFIQNDVNLNRTSLTVITGPNSGGKTTYCKTIAQNQILAQSGSYVVASEASINIADLVAYHAPVFDALKDEEGRFGTELKRTRDIFYRTTPKSLVILDELAEGTTFSEKMAQSHIILDGFYSKGNNTVLVTHNHQLATRLRKEQKGQYLQVEFDGENPTFRVIEGISRKSHAKRIAKKISFSKEDIKRHLIKEGYAK